MIFNLHTIIKNKSKLFSPLYNLSIYANILIVIKESRPCHCSGSKCLILKMTKERQNCLFCLFNWKEMGI